MFSCRMSLILGAILALQSQPSEAQSIKYGASISGEMHIPTQAECIDAVSTGQVLWMMPDGRLLIAKGEVIYWIAVNPATLDCTAAKFPPKAE